MLTKTWSSETKPNRNMVSTWMSLQYFKPLPLSCHGVSQLIKSCRPVHLIFHDISMFRLNKVELSNYNMTYFEWDNTKHDLLFHTYDISKTARFMEDLKKTTRTKQVSSVWQPQHCVLHYCGRASGKGIKGHQGASRTQNTILVGHQPQLIFSQNLRFKGHQAGWS